jgi:hypothetical protein
MVDQLVFVEPDLQRVDGAAIDVALHIDRGREVLVGDRRVYDPDGPRSLDELIDTTLDLTLGAWTP